MPKNNRKSGLLHVLPQYHPLRWFMWGSLILITIITVSTAIYLALGYHYRRDWTFMDCLFMVVITLSTIGYGDWLSIKGLFWVEVYTLMLAIIGVGVPAFVITNLTALVMEGLFTDVYKRQRMTKRIDAMRDHIIVCGAGTTGVHVVRELLKTQRPIVVIDHDEARLRQCAAEWGDFPYLVGQADHDALLQAAGVTRAQGLIACLTDDKENLFVALSARALNPRLRIVSKVLDEHARPKLVTAGANGAVNPTAIGGLRMVSELVRPSVVTFLDSMLRDPQADYRFEELLVPAHAPVAGKTLAQAQLRSLADVLVVALRRPDKMEFVYNPKEEERLEAGSVIVVLGAMAQIAQLRDRLPTAGAPA